MVGHPDEGHGSRGLDSISGGKGALIRGGFERVDEPRGEGVIALGGRRLLPLF